MASRPTGGCSRPSSQPEAYVHVSLDELKEPLEAEEARNAIRDEWRLGEPDAARRRALLDESLGHLDRQLELMRRRGDEIAALESDLAATRRRVLRRRRELREPS